MAAAEPKSIFTCGGAIKGPFFCWSSRRGVETAPGGTPRLCRDAGRSVANLRHRSPPIGFVDRRNQPEGNGILRGDPRPNSGSFLFAITWRLICRKVRPEGTAGRYGRKVGARLRAIHLGAIARKQAPTNRVNLRSKANGNQRVSQQAGDGSGLTAATHRGWGRVRGFAGVRRVARRAWSNSPPDPAATRRAGFWPRDCPPAACRSLRGSRGPRR